MKKILIPVSIIAVLLCTAAKDADQTVISPDRLFLADNGKSLFVTNRAGSELIKMSADGKEMEQKVEFSSPVNAMTQDPDGNLWVVCDGNYGMMYQLDGTGVSIVASSLILSICAEVNSIEVYATDINNLDRKSTRLNSSH